MKRFAILVAVLAAACQQEAPAPAPADTSTPPPAASTTTTPPAASAESLVPRMMSADLNALVKTGEVTVIDVRAADAYIAAHIPGSLHIPLSFIDQEAAYLPREKKIVTYCT